MISSLVVFAAGCDFLDPLPNGFVTEDTLGDFPSYIRGFVDKAYEKMPTTYISNEYLYLDAATDDAVITSSSSVMHISRFLPLRQLLDQRLQEHSVCEQVP